MRIPESQFSYPFKHYILPTIYQPCTTIREHELKLNTVKSLMRYVKTYHDWYYRHACTSHAYASFEIDGFYYGKDNKYHQLTQPEKQYLESLYRNTRIKISRMKNDWFFKRKKATK